MAGKTERSAVRLKLILGRSPVEMENEILKRQRRGMRSEEPAQKDSLSGVDQRYRRTE